MTSLDALADAGWRTVRPDTERVVRVRRAEGSDREALARMFDRCAPSTRYSRFHGPVKAIPARYLADALSGTPFHCALVACLAPLGGAAGHVAADQTAADQTAADQTAADQMAASGPEARAGTIVALASCRLTGEGAAELGVLVEDAWQRHGLGARLLGDLVAHARSIGLRVLEAQLLAEQSWTAGLLRAHGACRVRPAGGGVLHASLRLSEGQLDDDDV